MSEREPWERLIHAIEEWGLDRLRPLLHTNLPNPEDVAPGLRTVTLTRESLMRFRANHAAMLGALAILTDTPPDKLNNLAIIDAIYKKQYPPKPGDPPGAHYGLPGYADGTGEMRDL